MPNQIERSTSILIIHFHSTMNAGDLAQLSMAIADLRDHFTNPLITVSSNFPQELELQSLEVEIVPSIRSWIGLGRDRSSNQQRLAFLRAFKRIALNCLSGSAKGFRTQDSDEWEEIIRAYKGADLVISCPGNIFLSMGGFGFPFLCSSLSILPILCDKKPFYVMPQTIGPLHKLWERYVVKKLLSHARLIFLRDDPSYRLLEGMGLAPNHLKHAYDQSMRMPISTSPEIPRQLVDVGYHHDQRTMGVTTIPKLLKTIPEGSLSRYYSELAKALSKFVEVHNFEVYFFPQVTGPEKHEDDRRAAERVAKLMTCNGENVRILEERMTPQELRDSYRNMDLFVATRLHSAIFSMSEGVPTLLIGYVDKTKGVAQLFDWENYYLELRMLNEQLLSETLEDMWENQEALREKLLTQFSKITSDEKSPGKLIHHDYLRAST